MKQILLFLFSLLFAATAFGDQFTLDNQTAFPGKRKSKLAVQWATSAREVDAANKALIHGMKLNPATLHPLSAGKIVLNIPAKVEYFRILAWSKGGAEPDLHTNWIEIVPNKTYVLDGDYLVPVALLQGSGC